MYIASQILETIAFFIVLIGYHLKTKKNIFKTMCIANIFNIFHYLLLNAYSGCVTKIIALIRNLFIIEKEKNKKYSSNIYLGLFIICYIVLSIVTYKDIYSLLPFAAAIIYLIACFNGEELRVKKYAYYCYYLWLIYDICIHSAAASISTFILLVSTGIAYYNRKKEENEKHNI